MPLTLTLREDADVRLLQLLLHPCRAFSAPTAAPAWAAALAAQLTRMEITMSETKTTIADVKAELVRLTQKIDAADAREEVRAQAAAASIAALQALIDGPKDTSQLDGDLKEILEGMKAAETKADAIAAAPDAPSEPIPDATVTAA